jgi:quercetin dioxygenase-like cupin family protein
MERVAPPGAKSPPHSHNRSESFFVTDGEFDLTVGDQTFRGGAGAMIYAPEGTPHGWAAVGDKPGRMMILFSPSPPRAYYVELDASPPDFRAVIALSRQHGIL